MRCRNLKDRIHNCSDKDPATGCWNWRNRDEKGYGRIKILGQKKRAHRISWSVFVGPIPEGKFVCHYCDNPACVNPEHLFLGGVTENALDAKHKRRYPTGNKHPKSRSKLSKDQILAIHSDKRKLREIATDYGVSITCVHKIRTGTSWAEITGN